MSEHLAWEELAVGHALDALEPGEEVGFLGHLPGCARCARTVSDTWAVMAQLAYAAEPAEPPRAVLAGILAGVGADARPSPSRSVGHTRDVPVARVHREVRREPGGAGSRTWRRQAPWLIAAAAVLVAVALAGWNVALRAVDSPDGSDQAAVLAALEQPGTRTVQLTDNDGRARGTVLINGSRVDIAAHGLPANDPQRQVYVLWELRPGSTRAVGTFDVATPSLSVQQTGTLQGRLADVSGFAVTLERGRTAPAEGSGAVVSGTVDVEA